MTSSIQIGKAIKTILNKNGIDKVFPLVAEEGTTYPFIVYKRQNTYASDTKDRYNYQEVATVELLVAANSYKDSIEVAEKVRKVVEGTEGIFNEINIGNITVSSTSEDYVDTVYIQRLVLTIQII